MSENQLTPEEMLYQQMKSILKPMINSALVEKPKDPVIIINIIYILYY